MININNLIEKCYNCDGSARKTFECDYGTWKESEKKCTWRLAVENELEKISNNDANLTFHYILNLIDKDK